MKRPFTLALLGFVALSAPALAQQEMHLASWLPPTHKMNAVVIPTWSKWIEQATDGRVTIKIEYGLGNPKSFVDLVQDGAVDASWTFHGFIPGRFKLTQMAELPLLGAGPEAASTAYWRVYEKYLAAGNEHDGVVVAGLFTHGPGQIHMRKPIKTLEDLKGKKIRVGGGIQSLIGERLGIEPVLAPGNKVYEILAQGVADGAFMPMEVMQSLRLAEVAPFTMKLPQGMYLGSFGIFISPAFLDSLSAKDKAVILSVSGEKLSRMAGKAWGEADAEGEQFARDAGNTIVVADAAIEDDFVAKMKGIDEEWIKSVADRGVDARAALADFRTTAREIQHSIDQQ